MVIDCKDIDINSYQISDDEYISYFSKCKEHCKGCMNENTGLCSDMDIIDCYLHSLLPNGIWHKAVTNSLMTKNAKDIVKEINKQIITKLTSISK